MIFGEAISGMIVARAFYWPAQLYLYHGCGMCAECTAPTVALHFAIYGRSVRHARVDSSYNRLVGFRIWYEYRI